MKEFRITIRCANQPDKHAKILCISGHIKRSYLETLARLLDGSSPHYIHKPGPSSPIGKCATCGGQVETTIDEVEVDA